MTIRPARVSMEVVLGAARSLRANPLRTSLGMLAVAVAVATIALVITGLEGFVRSARETSARTFGSESFVISRVVAGEASRRELADKLARNPEIRRADVRFLERYGGGDLVYAPVAQRRAEVSVGGRSLENVSVTGTGAALADIRDLALARGRFLRRDEEERGSQVAVIGAEVADTLFPSRDPLGQRLRLAGRGFEVIGVQARQGTSGGLPLDRSVYVPLQAFERAFGATGSLQVFARHREDGQSAAAEDRARATMRARRQLRPGERDSFDVLTPAAARGFVARLSERAGAAAVPISLMALLAAIVVVANTTLVSVTERTREIGVRRALGAARRDIALEVVAESTLVAVAGGLAGLAAAQLLLAAASGPLGTALAVRGGTAAWGLAAAAGSGLLAGWFPAARAARLDVIAAIRQE